MSNHGFFRNQMIHIFGMNWWQQRIYILRSGSFSVKDASEIQFREDNWLWHTTLGEQYDALYNIVCHKSDTIATVMETSPPNVAFRRDLLGPRLVSWNALLQRLANVQLQDESNEFRWSLHKNEKFSGNSMYNALLQPNCPSIPIKNFGNWKYLKKDWMVSS
jgi:hypothetical protein